ncbi:MAG: carboxypeptidase regulatory-like domain-containing protein [Acidobacteriota bacterium]
MKRTGGIAASALLTLACAAFFPTAAHAQSAISGTVKDTSGAVLPGVTVEASSPVLIEKVRVATTNEQGQFAIVDLRPGLYRVAFTLAGFNTFVRDQVELPTDFTATLNVEMRVGVLEETITVTGESPVVDVSSTARVQVLTREALDALPTGRSIYAMAQLMPGISLNAPDVGGSRAMQQTYMSTRGLTSANNIVQVDGMMINGLDGDGAVQQYVNNAFIQEMTYQTAGAGADVSPGGVRVNIVPRDGGNQFSGSFFGAWTDGSWQTNNLDAKLRGLGLNNTDKITKIWDFNFGMGGPIKKDKLWFYGSARHWGVHAPIAGTYVVPAGRNVYDCVISTIACEQGIDDQQIKSAVLRLTWQVSPRNKISAYFDEIDKARGHGMNAGTDAVTASQIWTSPLYNDAVLKWTSTMSSRLLVEAGFSMNYEQYVIVNQPGVNQERGTPGWLAGASRRDSLRATLWNGFGSGQGGRYPDRYNIGAAASYVTGSHNIKVGFQRSWGPYENTRDTNADLQQVYANGVANQVTVYNTPLRYLDTLLADWGLFAQDSWTLNRLTVNYGLRWEYLKHEVSAATSPAGRFIGERRFEAIPMPTWKDPSPRFGVVYDLFGNAKTALKFGLNRYNESRTTFFANNYNPLRVQAQTLSWTDLNSDDIAQGDRGCVYLTPGCEINFAQLPATFGTPRLNTVDPNFKRVNNVETTAGIQHEIISRVSMSANWYRRSFHNLRVTDNLLRTMNDYQPYNVFHPITGQPWTIHDVTTSALPRVENFDTNSSDRSHVYNAFDLTVNARLSGGAMLFGGFVTERNLRNICDEPDDPNMLFYCDDSQNDIPYRPTFKLSGTYPLPWGISVSAAWQDSAGRPLGLTTTAGNKISGPGYGDTGSPVGTNWFLQRTTRYPANCPAPCPAGQLVFPAGTPQLTSASLTLPLVAAGTEFLPRWRQIDLSFAKWFQIGNYRLQGQLDIFNATNSNVFTAVRSTNFDTAAYKLPASVLQGRQFRVGGQVRW